MLRKVGTLLAFGLLLIAGPASAQSGNSGTTHVVLSNDQRFLVSNDKYLSGVYECSDGGYIDFSCITGHLPTISCPTNYAIQVIDPSGVASTCVQVANFGPAGSDTYVQYNNMNLFGADQYFTWDYNNQILRLGIPGTAGFATLGGSLLADLGTPDDGTLAYCSDCTAGSNPCSGSGTGAFAERLNGAWNCGTSGVASGYDTIEDEATPLTQRTTLNFTGAGVTCVDNSSDTRTDCTISGGGGSLSGTTNHVTKFTSSSTVGDSVATEDGTTFTVGAVDLSYSQALYITGNRAISTSVSADATDRLVSCTSGSSTDKTYTLPAPTGSGRIIDIFKVDTGTKACIIGTASGAINSGTTLTMNVAFQGETCWDQGSGQWVCRGSAH